MVRSAFIFFTFFLISINSNCQTDTTQSKPKFEPIFGGYIAVPIHLITAKKVGNLHLFGNWELYKIKGLSKAADKIVKEEARSIEMNIHENHQINLSIDEKPTSMFWDLSNDSDSLLLYTQIDSTHLKKLSLTFFDLKVKKNKLYFTFPLPSSTNKDEDLIKVVLRRKD
ncbi:MAG: hypothetical protein MI810_17980 [Flavobacteriales bacterium]|nr:hypothetical protein [Flavobacteriales bacterium]